MLFIGRAQEKTRIFRTERRRNPSTGVAYPWIVTATAMVNCFYIYAVDGDFGPFFLKFGSYFPYTGRLCVNGHEYAKREAAKLGIGFTALDNGFATIEPDDVATVQAICALTEDTIDALLRKWLARLPHPFTPADRAAGYRYEPSVLQAEFSLTQVHDKPVSGRIFFEQTIRDNLDIGRPDQVALIFNRQVRRNNPERSGPGSSPTPWPRACTSPTSTAGSSSTTSTERRCAPKPRSTTPTTSPSADG